VVPSGNLHNTDTGRDRASDETAPSVRSSAQPSMPSCPGAGYELIEGHRCASTAGFVEPFNFAAVGARQPTSRARVLEVRIQFPPAKSQRTIGSATVDRRDTAEIDGRLLSRPGHRLGPTRRSRGSAASRSVLFQLRGTGAIEDILSRPPGTKPYRRNGPQHPGRSSGLPLERTSTASPRSGSSVLPPITVPISLVR
jgi:hypothetical protein